MDEFDSADFYSGKSKHNYVQFYQKEFVKVDGEAFTRDMVLIVCPGQRDECRRPVQEKDKKEYAEQWRAYKEQRTQETQGTPIEMLPGMTDDLVKLYRLNNVHTIEQGSGISDLHLNNLGMGAAMRREMCRSYLQRHGPEMGAVNKALEEANRRIAELEAKLDGGGKPPPMGLKKKEAA